MRERGAVRRVPSEGLTDNSRRFGCILSFFFFFFLDDDMDNSMEVDVEEEMPLESWCFESPAEVLAIVAGCDEEAVAQDEG